MRRGAFRIDSIRSNRRLGLDASRLLRNGSSGGAQILSMILVGARNALWRKSKRRRRLRGRRKEPRTKASPVSKASSDQPREQARRGSKSRAQRRATETIHPCRAAQGRAAQARGAAETRGSEARGNQARRDLQARRGKARRAAKRDEILGRREPREPAEPREEPKPEDAKAPLEFAETTPPPAGRRRSETAIHAHAPPGGPSPAAQARAAGQ